MQYLHDIIFSRNGQIIDYTATEPIAKQLQDLQIIKKESLDTTCSKYNTTIVREQRRRIEIK